MFYFWWHFNRAASICNSIFPAAGSARWRLGARSALDNPPAPGHGRDKI
jgi:hypothetical protein